MTSASNKSTNSLVSASMHASTHSESGRDALDNIAELSQKLPADVVQRIYDDVVFSLAVKAGLIVKSSDKSKLVDSNGPSSDS